VTSAFYLPTREPGHFTATEHTGGPWDAALQHGGPPAALLARAAERETQAWPSTVVRMAVEILGPIPVGEVSVASHVARSGRSVELVEAELSAAGRIAVRARAWRVRLAELDLPGSVAVPTDTPPFPAEDTEPPAGWPGGFIQSMDCRFATGSWNAPGPATMWGRLRMPLVDGEETSGLQRLMTLADCGNGISSALPIGEWIFINPDLTVHLSRYPAGEWLCIDAVTTADPRGFGVATSTLYDQSGRVGHGAQSLFIESR
jgi:hypothetical protein